MYQRTQSLLDADPSASAGTVANALAAEFAPAPDPRTVNDWLKKGVVRRPDPSEIWRVSDATAEEARLVLPVLAGVIEHTRGDVRRFTKAQAAWIAKLRHLSDERMPAWRAYVIADAYLWWESHAVDTTFLDHYLAFANWKTWPMANTRYARAVAEWGVEFFGVAEVTMPSGDAAKPLESNQETE
jgi:hypothetical protein